MTIRFDPTPQPAERPSESSSRRTYARPQLLYREPLETLAAVCSPRPPAKGNPGACPLGPISS